MKAGVAELKASLSRYLERVKGGQEVLVTAPGRPVAKLVPVAHPDKGSRRDGLIRAGLLLPGRGKVRPALLKPPPKGPGAAVLDALIEERREGR